MQLKIIKKDKRFSIRIYGPNDEDLELLAEAVIQSNTKTAKALKEAHKAIKEILNYFARKSQKEKKGTNSGRPANE